MLSCSSFTLILIIYFYIQSICISASLDFILRVKYLEITPAFPYNFFFSFCLVLATFFTEKLQLYNLLLCVSIRLEIYSFFSCFPKAVSAVLIVLACICHIH